MARPTNPGNGHGKAKGKGRGLTRHDPRTFRVVRVSRASGRVLKVVASGLTRDDADRYVQTAAETGPRTALHVQPEGGLA